MNWDALGAIAELLGSVAVLINLIYLAMQIRQNSKSLRINVEQSISDSLSDLYQQVANTDLAHVYFKASRFGFFATSYFRKVEQAHLQYLTDNLSKESWESIDVAFLLQFQSLGIQKYWESRGSQYRTEFHDYVESLKLRETRGVDPRAAIRNLAGDA